MTAVRRAFCLLCCAAVLLSVLFFSASAADGYAYPKPEVLQIDLIMQPYRYLKMTHSMEKQKYDAVVCMNEGEPLKIGVQVRGDRSLKEGMDMPSKRIPLELCFDYADPDGTFRGNPSLKLINCLTPARVLTQLIAMETFAFLDIPTPNTTPAFIRINDTDLGVYLAVEDINEAFAQNHFGGASLYRPVSTIRDTDESMRFSFDMITMTAKVDCGSETVERYIEASNSGKNVESFFDTDEFLRFMACETFLMNVDGFLYNNRNFYLADDHGKFKLLPWDKDDVFPVFEDLENYATVEHHANKTFQLLMENETNFARYRDYIRKLNDEFLNPDTFLPWLEEYIEVLSPYFQRDKTIRMGSDNVKADLTTGNELFNTLCGNLPLTFKTYHDEADAVLAGKEDTFYIPEDMTLAPYECETDAARWKSGFVIPFRICAGYWRLQRQALWKSGGTAISAILVLFALVFVCTILAVFRPMHKKRSRRRNDHAA